MQRVISVDFYIPVDAGVWAKPLDLVVLLLELPDVVLDPFMNLGQGVLGAKPVILSCTREPVFTVLRVISV